MAEFVAKGRVGADPHHGVCKYSLHDNDYDIKNSIHPTDLNTELLDLDIVRYIAKF